MHRHLGVDTAGAVVQATAAAGMHVKGHEGFGLQFKHEAAVCREQQRLERIAKEGRDRYAATQAAAAKS